MWTDISVKKCKIGVSETSFFGLIFSQNGISPAPNKIEVLRKMNKPTAAAEVHSLLGMAQYSYQFISNVSALTTPLRELINTAQP